MAKRKSKKSLLHRASKLTKPQMLLASLLVAGLAGAVVLWAQAAERPLVLWPHIYYQGGSYGNAQDIEQADEFVATGLDFDNAGPRTADQFLRQRGIKSFDGNLRTIIKDMREVKKTDAQILVAIENYLKKDHVKNDSNLIGFIVLDDYKDDKNDVKALLPQVRALVVKANKTAATKRAVICPFSGGPLDRVDGNLHDNQADIDDYVTRALSNYSPDGCDLVSFYIYGGNGHNADFYDWDMSKQLPRLKKELSKKGWNERLQPLIGTPQTFLHADYPTPSTSQMATQTEAFCKQGAVAIWAYTWYNTPTGTNLANTPSLRAGLEDGLERCRRIWPKPLTGNQLYNAGFEKLVTGNVSHSAVRHLHKWVVNDKRDAKQINGTVHKGDGDLQDGAVHKGDGALQVWDKSNKDGVSATQLIRQIPGAKRYTFSGFYRRSIGSDKQALYLDYLDKDFQRIGEPAIAHTTVGPSVWKLLTVSRTVPSGTAYVRVIIYSAIAAESRYNWDSIRLVPSF